VDAGLYINPSSAHSLTATPATKAEALCPFQPRPPAATAAHKPIPHIAVVEKLTEALGFRQIGVVQEEYTVSADGMRMFGVMDLRGQA
jgi:hypothetical protein